MYADATRLKDSAVSTVRARCLINVQEPTLAFRGGTRVSDANGLWHIGPLQKAGPVPRCQQRKSNNRHCMRQHVKVSHLRARKSVPGSRQPLLRALFGTKIL